MAKTERIRGRELQRRRERLFARSPWCVKCLPRGLKTRATIRARAVPLDEGGTEDEANEEALCLDCFEAKKETEAQRGLPPSKLTNSFRKRATPRNEAGHFSPRRGRF